MRIYLVFLFLLLYFQSSAQLKNPNNNPVPAKVMSPLSTYSVEWNQAQYVACNTAKDIKYMTAKEKEVIYILNLIRSNPSLFAKTVLAAYPEKGNQPWLSALDNYKTLVDTLLVLPPLNLLKPDYRCYQSAYCHAQSCSKKGLMGHDRKTAECEKKTYFNGECIDYGFQDPLDILLHLMIDEGVPSLGHRLICISSYNGIGVSIQNHKSYTYSTVLDFTFARE
ncbi:MAG: CAP domain-containing protein [Chitinophagaceae bacterium]